ncbi:hypothetical protein J3F83DRAFT_259707 [Trichoderma novae-zelandiae]
MDAADEFKTADIGDPSRLHSNRRQGQRILATVYDAVAGRVTYDGVLRGEGQDHRSHQPGIVDQRSARDGFKLAPDEALFRRKDAPERYAEHDIYRAHEWELPNGGQGVLPKSDLLQAIHEYSSEFYGVLNHKQRVLEGGRNLDERSMDETALLALGILLEEAGREVLGRRGHLVFTEGTHDAHDDSGGEQAEQGGSAAQDSGSDAVVDKGSDEAPKQGRKRRKLAKADDDD